MRQVVAQRITPPKLGSAIDLDPEWPVLNERCQVVDEQTGSILAIFLKGELKDRPDLIESGRNMVKYFEKRKYASTTLRGTSSGYNKSVVFGEGKKNEFKQGNRVLSTTLGYAPPNSFNPCRKTVLYRQHEHLFDSDTLPLIQRISEIHSEYAPIQFNELSEYCRTLNPLVVLPKTVYTTATINHTYRTLCHRDRDDKSGLTPIAVFKVGEYSGGEFMMPEFGLAINLEEGDVLLVQVHELHCNAEIQGSGRISIVCYCSEKISKCGGVTKEELETPKFKRRSDRGQPNGNIGLSNKRQKTN